MIWLRGVATAFVVVFGMIGFFAWIIARHFIPNICAEICGLFAKKRVFENKTGCGYMEVK